MADKVTEQTEVPVEVTEKEKKVVEPEATVVVEEEDSKSENGDAKENGDAEKKENGKEAATNGDSKPIEEEAAVDKCSIKRKSTGTVDAAKEEKSAEGVTPEKKAKLDEPAEAESNGEAEVAA